MKVLTIAYLLLLCGQALAQPPTPKGAETAGDIHTLMRYFNNPDTRRQAAEGLRKFGEEIPRAAYCLASLLEDGGEESRLLAARALKELGPSAKDAVPSLIKALHREESDVVLAEVIRALGAMAPQSKAAVPHLLPFLEDGQREVRISALWAVGRFGADGKAAVPFLIKALEDKGVVNPKTGQTFAQLAANSLADIGPEATPAVPALIKALKADHRQLRGDAIRALGWIGAKDPAVVPTLIAVLRDRNDTFFRSSAAVALARIGPEAKEAVPALLEALKAEDLKDENRIRGTRSAVMTALGHMGAAAKEAVPVLADIFKDQQADYGLRRQAAEALGKIGPAAKEAIPTLVGVLNDPQSESYHPDARNALGNMGREAVPALLDLYRHSPNRRVRTYAAEALARIGPEAKDAVPALTKALNSTDISEVDAAKKALKAIQKKVRNR